MPISTQCPHCAAYDSFPDAEAGKSVTCPACGGAIALPLKARPVAAAVVAQAKPIAAAPVVKAAPVAAKPLSKPVIDLDEEEDDRPRKKKSKPVVELDEDEDDRPRKKSKPVVNLDADDAPPPKSKSQSEFAFDDDADEAPKKKKPRRRDDDEDEDDRPRRKPAKKEGGSGKVLIILGCVGIAILGTCTGAVIYWVNKADKALTGLSQMTFPNDPEATKPTKPADGKSKVKENIGNVVRGDTAASVSTKLGVGSDAMLIDLQDLQKTFNEGNGPQTKADLQTVLDAYAPWVDKGRGIMYRDGANFRALIVYSGVSPKKQDWKVHGVLTVEQIGNRSEYNEQVGLAHVTAGDPEAQKLNLKGWKNFRVDDGTGGEEQPVAGLKDKARKLMIGDPYGPIRASWGRGPVYNLAAFKSDIQTYRTLGADAVLTPDAADALAPWIDKECALAWSSGKLKVVIVFNTPPLKPGPADARAVKAAFSFDEKDGVGEFVEYIAIATDLDNDPSAKVLGLKPYKDLKPVGAGTTPEPPKPSESVKITAADLAAEIIKDRAVAGKKYAGTTLEITGEVQSKSSSGAVLILKGGTDEIAMKAIIVPVSMKLDQREAAKACSAGDTVTVTGTLGPVPATASVIPIREGVLKK